MTGPVSGARLAAILLGLALVVALASLGALFLGSARVPPGDVLAVLAGRVRGVDQVVVLSLRLPRILAALLAGGALAVAGAGFQALSRNPLAEPSVLGVSSGAAFGVIVAQVFGLGGGLVEVLGLAACAFAGALAAGMAVYLIAASAGGLPVHTLLLAGVIISLFFFSATWVRSRRAASPCSRPRSRSGSGWSSERLGSSIFWRSARRARSSSGWMPRRSSAGSSRARPC
jgi:ABC-type Fe3+-siderophore transport system permease subunit